MTDFEAEPSMVGPIAKSEKLCFRVEQPGANLGLAITDARYALDNPLPLREQQKKRGVT